MGKRTASRIMLTLFLISMLRLALNIQSVKAEPKTWIVDDDGPADFHTIQEAINAAGSGDTIHVASGTYYEHVTMNKSLRLIGEYNHTIITALYPQHTTFTFRGFVVEVTEDNVEIRQFRIRGEYGIRFYHCNNNIVADNIIHNKYSGLSLVSSNNNTIVGNTIYSNYPGLYMESSTNNTIFHNNFIDNQDQIGGGGWSFVTWDNGKEGNYWSNYQGLDSDGDGIGDTPYSICTNNRDHYPLMTPWNPQGLLSSLSISCSSSTAHAGFRVNINGRLAYINGSAISGPRITLSYSVTNGASWNDITSVTSESDGNYSAQWFPLATGIFIVKAAWAGDVSHGIWRASAKVNISVVPFVETYVFSVVSNSTVSQLNFESAKRELTFTVEGPSGTEGYADVCIAKTLIGNIEGVEVKLNGTEIDYTATSIDDSYLIHFTYQHSAHTVAVNLGLETVFVDGMPSPLIYLIAGAAVVAIVVGIAIVKIRKTKAHRIESYQSEKSQPAAQKPFTIEFPLRKY